jgi:hypothetical protein
MSSAVYFQKFCQKIYDCDLCFLWPALKDRDSQHLMLLNNTIRLFDIKLF